MHSKIILAKSAGFCFGVSRAVDSLYNELEKGNECCTLGEIIHNPDFLSELDKKGVKVVENVAEAKDSTLIIRAHGVSSEVKNQIEKSKINCIDATCPYVSKIQKIVLDNSKKGDIIFIFGNKNHPEIIGIKGHSESECFIFNDINEFETFVQDDILDKNTNISVVVQTTFEHNKWQKIKEIIKKVYTNAKIFDTICSATIDRQEEARKLAEKVDVMIIIGGTNSSNTVKLFDICKELTTTYLVKNATEIKPEFFKKAESIGVSAGASTPRKIIEEVLLLMSTIIEDEENFAKLFEESIKEESSHNDRVKGVVTRIYPNEVYVDVIGRKQAGLIMANELSSDKNVKTADVVKVGDELDLMIIRTNDQDGLLMLSKKRLDAQKGWTIIEDAEANNTVLEGTIADTVKGGVIIIYEGVRVFIPASHASNIRVDDLSTLKGQKVTFKIIETNRYRKKAVGSVKLTMPNQSGEQATKFWEEAEEGKSYTGRVKSLTKYGAFVDLGGVDGMIHISELSYKKIKDPSEVVSVGDTVDVVIKSLDKENKKVSLTYKNKGEDPWESLKKNHKIGDILEGKIVGVTSFGAFANVLNGIDGLIHISEINAENVEKVDDVLSVGQQVKTKIIDIDFDKRRLSLSLKID